MFMDIGEVLLCEVKKYLGNYGRVSLARYFREEVAERIIVDLSKRPLQQGGFLSLSLSTSVHPRQISHN